MADSLQETERQRREFIANISHELKTPMTSIAGYTDGILDGTIPPEKEKEYLHIISDESRRLSRLVRRETGNTFKPSGSKVFFKRSIGSSSPSSV